MKKITVSLDDETYRRAHMHAARRAISISTMIKQFLVETTAGENESTRLKSDEAAIRSAIRAFNAGDQLSRDEPHARES